MALQIGQDCSRVLERAAMNMQAPARGDMWLFLVILPVGSTTDAHTASWIFFAVCKPLFTMEVLSILQCASGCLPWRCCRGCSQSRNTQHEVFKNSEPQLRSLGPERQSETHRSSVKLSRRTLRFPPDR